MTKANLYDWIDNPNGETAGESLGALIESRVRTQLPTIDSGSGTDMELREAEARTDARAKYQTLTVLAKQAGISRAEILRRSR
jgi:hypothetical protein